MRRVAACVLVLAACTDSAQSAGDGATGSDGGGGAIDLAAGGGDGGGGGGGAAAMLARKLRGKADFLVGMGNDLASDHNQDGAFTLGVTLDIHYTYLVGLQHVCVANNCQINNSPSNQCGWPDWNTGGTFVNVITDSSDAHGVTPMFTLYSMATCGENNFNSLVNDAYMGPYWDSAKLMYQRLAAFGKPAIVHLEPDFWAFAEQHAPGGDPTKIPVHVSALAADCASLPDDLTGMGQCLLKLGRQYAPKAVIGFHASEWAGPPDQASAFLNKVGAGTADVIVVDTLDRDAGCFESGTDPNCQGRGTTGFYWDETNTTSPNFHDHLAWATAIHNGVNLPVLWWQTPFGVPSATAGGTAGHYRDNRVHYVFNHIDEFVAAGGVGAVFGTGAGNQTYIDSDNNQFKDAVTNYLAHPVALP